MLLTIYNLPSSIQYGEIKMLIKSKCGLTDVILDNLLRDGDTKKVTVGLAEEADAAILVRKFNGLYVDGQQLYVEDTRLKKPKQQKFLSVKDLIEESQSQKEMYKNMSFQEEVQPQNEYQNQPMLQGFQNQVMVPPNQMMMLPMDFNVPSVPNMPVQQGMLGYNYFGGMSQVQTPFQGFGNQPQFPEQHVQQQSFGFGNGEPERNVQENRSKWEADKMSYGSERRHSPDRIRSGKNEHFSRWNAPSQENQDTRRRSRSPSRWNQRNTYESTSFGNQYPKEENRNNYGKKRSVVYTETFTSSTFRNDPGNAGAFNSGRPTVFGDHVTDQPYEPASWDDTPRERNQRQVRPSRNNDRKQRWDEDSIPSRNDRRRDDPETFRTRVRSSQRPSRPESRRDFQKAPPKRYHDRNEREPEPKRFAGQNQREERPRPSYKPRAPQAFQQTSGFRPRGPTYDKPRFVPKPSSSQVRPPGHQVREERAQKSTPKFRNVPPADPNQPPVFTKKDITWRFQTASNIAKDMLKNLEITDMGQQDDILSQLKHNIRMRLEDMMGTNSVTILEMTNAYRQKFPQKDDQAFFVSVLDNMKKENAEKVKKEKTGIKPVPVKKEKAEQVGGKPKQNQNAAGAVDHQRLPKYPNADKTAYNQRKQIQKQEIQNEDMYDLPASLKRALDEETDVLCDLFMAECENLDEDDEEAKKICEHMMDHTSDEFRKVIRMALTKRLLNITTSLLVRIFSAGKLPRRDLLDAFLKKYGVLSVKKSDNQKMFVANVDTYEHYDALCKLGSAEIDNKTVNFKPMYLAGPPAKITKAQIINHRRNFIESQIDKSGESLLGDVETKQVDHVSVQESKTLDKSEDVSEQDKAHEENDVKLEVEQGDVEQEEEQKDDDVEQYVQNDGDDADVLDNDNIGDDLDNDDCVDDDDLEDY